MLPNTADQELSAEDVRSLLYEIAADAHLACMALDARAEDCEEDETIAAIWRLLERTKSRAEDVAKGPTFDRLSKLEMVRLL